MHVPGAQQTAAVMVCHVLTEAGRVLLSQQRNMLLAYNTHGVAWQQQYAMPTSLAASTSALVLQQVMPPPPAVVFCCWLQPCLLCLSQAKENLELRMKYADEPMKFLDNEVDLMSLIRGLAQVQSTRHG